MLANERTTQVFRPTGNWNPTDPCSTLFLSPLFFFFSFLSPPTQNHHPTTATFPPIYQHLKSIFLSTPPRPSFRLRNGIETRSRGTRDPTQRRDYTRGRVDTNHHPFELENPRIRFLLSGQLLLQESNHACLITLPFNRFSHSIQSEITAESLLAFDLIKNGGVGPRFASSTRLRFSREFLSKLGGLLGVLGVFLGLVGIILWIEYGGIDEAVYTVCYSFEVSVWLIKKSNNWWYWNFKKIFNY